ncbi:MAG: hypothetical protein AAGC53_02385 [Actinomycetota bacterium]
MAPSILTYDRVAAAVGSCGIKGRQVDWSDWANQTVPGTITALDGTEITVTVADPDNVQDAVWNFRVYNGTINGRDNPAITGMSNATSGQGVTVSLQFSRPVQPSFFLVDVDQGTRGWQDRVDVRGFLTGGSPIDPDSLTVGGTAVQVVSPRLVEGVSSSRSANSEVEVDFQDFVDTIEIRHHDETTWRSFQWIGVHDLHWC